MNKKSAPMSIEEWKRSPLNKDKGFKMELQAVSLMLLGIALGLTMGAFLSWLK